MAPTFADRWIWNSVATTMKGTPARMSDTRSMVISTRPLCRKLLKGKTEKTNAEALIGKICVVTEEIRNIDEVGEVKVGGLHWSARAEDPTRVIAVGEHVVVMEIQGVKLIVK